MTTSQWTPAERLEIVAKIAKELGEHPATKRDNRLMDIQERLLFLALGSAFVLEANRGTIIEGTYPQPESQ